MPLPPSLDTFRTLANSAFFSSRDIAVKGEGKTASARLGNFVFSQSAKTNDATMKAFKAALEEEYGVFGRHAFDSVLGQRAELHKSLRACDVKATLSSLAIVRKNRFVAEANRQLDTAPKMLELSKEDRLEVRRKVAESISKGAGARFETDELGFTRILVPKDRAEAFFAAFSEENVQKLTHPDEYMARKEGGDGLAGAKLYRPVPYTAPKADPRPLLDPAIYVAEGSSVTIGGAGQVEAIGGANAAGIGGRTGETRGTAKLNITGGTIVANGGANGSGIGAAKSAGFGITTISGSTIIATGKEGAAGIGGSAATTNLTISVSGGTITARGGVGRAGVTVPDGAALTIDEGSSNLSTSQPFNPLRRRHDPHRGRRRLRHRRRVRRRHRRRLHPRRHRSRPRLRDPDRLGRAGRLAHRRNRPAPARPRLRDPPRLRGRAPRRLGRRRHVQRRRHRNPPPPGPRPRHALLPRRSAVKQPRLRDAEARRRRDPKPAGCVRPGGERAASSR